MVKDRNFERHFVVYATLFDEIYLTDQDEEH